MTKYYDTEDDNTPLNKDYVETAKYRQNFIPEKGEDVLDDAYYKQVRAVLNYRAKFIKDGFKCDGDNNPKPTLCSYYGSYIQLYAYKGYTLDLTVNDENYYDLMSEYKNFNSKYVDFIFDKGCLYITGKVGKEEVPVSISSSTLLTLNDLIDISGFPIPEKGELGYTSINNICFNSRYIKDYSCNVENDCYVYNLVDGTNVITFERVQDSKVEEYTGDINTILDNLKYSEIVNSYFDYISNTITFYNKSNQKFNSPINITVNGNNNYNLCFNGEWKVPDIDNSTCKYIADYISFNSKTFKEYQAKLIVNGINFSPLTPSNLPQSDLFDVEYNYPIFTLTGKGVSTPLFIQSDTNFQLYGKTLLGKVINDEFKQKAGICIKPKVIPAKVIKAEIYQSLLFSDGNEVYPITDSSKYAEYILNQSNIRTANKRLEYPTGNRTVLDQSVNVSYKFTGGYMTFGDTNKYTFESVKQIYQPGKGIPHGLYKTRSEPIPQDPNEYVLYSSPDIRVATLKTLQELVETLSSPLTKLRQDTFNKFINDDRNSSEVLNSNLVKTNVPLERLGLYGNYTELNPKPVYYHPVDYFTAETLSFSYSATPLHWVGGGGVYETANNGLVTETINYSTDINNDLQHRSDHHKVYESSDGNNFEYAGSVITNDFLLGGGASKESGIFVGVVKCDYYDNGNVVMQSLRYQTLVSEDKIIEAVTGGLGIK